jgi:hypothetical protein
MIDGWKRASSARIGETFADICLRHVLPDRRDVFHHMSITIDDLLCHYAHVILRAVASGFAPISFLYTETGEDVQM